jgi:hypothetical protein
MKYPSRVQEIINELAARNPALVRGDDEARRQLTRLIAEQCRFELGPNWGTKRASETRPLSADVVCTQDPFVGWDTQIAGGTIAQFPESIDLTGQVFVPVDPVQHLAVSDAHPDSQCQIQQQIDALRARLDRLEHEVLRSGDRVGLRTNNSHVICAEGGGGGEIHSRRESVGPWEAFVVEKQ